MFALLGVLQVFVHEPWRDEWQAWMLARDSTSISQLFENLRYEGYPPLWHLLLFGLSRLTRDILAMQVAHLFIGMVGAAVILWHAPFSRVNRALLVLGYFPVFEYLAVSRPYVMTAALLFMYCWLRWSPKRQGSSPALPALALAGMALTTVYGALLALCLMAVELVALIRPGGPAPSGSRAVLVAGGLAVAGSTWSMLPPADSGVNYPWVLAVHPRRLGSVVIDVAHAFVPLGRSIYPFRWNSSFFELTPRPVLIASGLLVVTLGGMLYTLRRRFDAIALVSLGALAVSGFSYAKVPGFPRHTGHLVLVLLAAAWLASSGHEGKASVRTLQRVLTPLLLVQVICAGAAIVSDVRFPFSGSKRAAELVEQVDPMGERFVIAEPDDLGIPVSGWLDRYLYYPNRRSTGTSLRWDDRRICQLPRVTRCHRQRIREVLLDPTLRRDRPIFVTDRRLTDAPGARLVGTTGRSMVDTERYFVYELDPLPPRPAPPPRARSAGP